MKKFQKNYTKDADGKNCTTYPKIAEKELIAQLRVAIDGLFNADLEENERGLYMRFYDGQSFLLSAERI